MNARCIAGVQRAKNFLLAASLALSNTRTRVARASRKVNLLSADGAYGGSNGRQILLTRKYKLKMVTEGDWLQNYSPLRHSVAWSALAAAMPVLVPLYLLGVLRKPAWQAALAGLVMAALVALFIYEMPLRIALGAVTYGAAFGIFPISWIVFWAIVLFQITLDTGNFEVIKDSISGVTSDRRLQALLIAFSFGAFIEGATGFGAPIAVSAAMLTGLGFSRFQAAGVCLLANTAPVAFGSIGIPVITLAGVTGLPLLPLSSWVGRICAPISLCIPAYLVFALGGLAALRGVLPAVVVCGVAFGGTQLFASNYLGPQLTDILSSLATIGSLLALLRCWQPRDAFRMPGEVHAPAPKQHSADRIFRAWLPYLLLVLFVLLWGLGPLTSRLGATNLKIAWPFLDGVVVRTPPVVANSSVYPAVFLFNFLTTPGTACMCAVFASALALRVKPRELVLAILRTFQKLSFSILTIASVLALAFLMNYSGATGTLGLAFAATGRTFPFFSPLLGWIGVFLVGSDTSANAMFGNLQIVTAGRLGLDPVLMAAANSSGGVMGKMISLQSIAVARAATGMPPAEEARLFRFTLKHSVILVLAISVVVSLYCWLH